MKAAEKEIVFDSVSLSYFTFNQGINSFKDLLTSLSMKRIFEKKYILNDLNFSIPRGQTVGVLGRNGAGKSTLLKAVAGMLKPSSGTILINGNVAPILAIGAGTEMELTGRENIKLTGSLMGYSKHDLKSKNTEIEQFSELSDKELDMPMKTYSTGMLSRLGFSTAVANNPEILIVDEVLAVGDEGFQRKCLARIREIKEQGNTILFVSHNVTDIAHICDRTLCLENGEIAFDGSVSEGIDIYKSLFQR